MKIISIGTLILILGIFGLYIVDRDKTGTYFFIPNRTIMAGNSYLMEIKDQKALDELEKHPSVLMKERLAIGNYLEKTSAGT